MSRQIKTEEFKKEAVRLVIEQHLSIAQAARDLGIGLSTLNKWVHKEKLAKLSEKPPASSEIEEIKKLKKEVQTLRMERDILKKATAYFAKHLV